MTASARTIEAAIHAHADAAVEQGWIELVKACEIQDPLLRAIAFKTVLKDVFVKGCELPIDSFTRTVDQLIEEHQRKKGT